MNKKILGYIGAVLFALGVACGPKMASKETLSKLEELKMAIEKVQTEIANCENQKKELLNQKEEKTKLIEKLKAERDSLKTLLELIKQGY